MTRPWVERAISTMVMMFCRHVLRSVSAGFLYASKITHIKREDLEEHPSLPPDTHKTCDEVHVAR